MRFTLVAVLLFAGASGAADAVHPAQPWDAPFSDDVKGIIAAADKAPTRKDQEYQVLLEETRIDYDAQGLETFSRRLVIRVLSADMASHYDSIEADWDTWHEERPELRVRTIQPDGTVSVLDASTITEAAARKDDEDIYSNRKTLRAPVPNVRAQTIVEREVSIREKPSLFQGRFVREVPVSNGWWSETLRVVVHAAPNLPLHVGWRGGEGQAPKPTREDGVQTVRYEQSPSPAQTEWVPFLPIDRPSSPRLYVSIGKSWPEHAKAYAEIVDGQLAASKPLAEQAKEIAGTATSPFELTQRFSTWMHEKVRYTGLHFNDAAVVPRPPSETVERGFGDCKDLATLMVAMLRAVGVKANVALLTAEGPDFPQDAPGLTQFDHAIVYVQGKSPFFFDATDDTVNAGEVSPWIAGRATLVTDPSLKNPIVRIPDAKSKDHGWKLKRTIHLAEIDEGSFESRIEEHGYYAQSRRRELLHAAPDEREKNAKDLVKKLLGCSELTRNDATPGDLTHPSTLELAGAKCDRVRTGDRDAEVAISLGALFTDVPTQLTGWQDEGEEEEGDKASKPRTEPFRWGAPIAIEGEYLFVPPPGFRTATQPDSKSWKLGPATFARAIAVLPDGTVRATAKFDSGPRTYTAAEAEAFKKAFAELEDDLQIKARFERISTAELEAGHVPEAFAEFRKWTTAHPKEALHHLSYANALLSLGFGAIAREEALKGVQAQPDSSAAHRVYSYMLQNDLLGQQYAPGWDRAKAIAEYRKALELKADAPSTQRALAHLLERNDDGEMYGPGASLPEAITLYQAARKARKDDTVDLNLLIALWRAGRAKEALELSDELPSGHVRNQIRLATTAVAKGVDAAIAELPRLADGAERDGLVVGTLAELIVMREYSTGAQFAKKAGMPSNAQADQQRRLLESARRAEEVKVPSNDPKAAVLRFFDLLVNPKSIDPHKVFAKATKVDGPQITIVAETVRHALGRLGVPMPTVRDLLYALPDYTFEGSPETGAKVTFLGFGPNKGGAYLVFEGGEWRVRALSPDRGTIAQEALARLDKGDLAGAKKWATWLQAEPSPSSHMDAERAWRAAWPKIAELPADKLRLALAWGAVEGSPPEERKDALATLQKASATTLSEPERTAIDWALIDGTSESDPDVALAAIDRLAAKRPSPVLPIIRVRTLVHAGRKDEALKKVDELLTEEGEDPDTLEFAASTASHVDQPALARTYRQRAIATGRASAATYNNLAWAELYTDPISVKDAEEHANRAAQLSNYGDGYALHTLACVHAETGRGKTAHELLMKSLEIEQRTEPKDYDWYVIGRIAEGYGLDDVARDAYARASKTGPEAAKDEPTQLAAKRLAGMKATQVAVPVP